MARRKEISIVEGFSRLIPKGNIHNPLPEQVLTNAVPWVNRVFSGMYPEGISSQRDEFPTDYLIACLINHEESDYLIPRLGEVAAKAIMPWFLQPFEDNPSIQTLRYLGNGLNAIQWGGTYHLTPDESGNFGDLLIGRYRELFRDPARLSGVDQSKDPYQKNHEMYTPNVRIEMIFAIANSRLSLTPEQRDEFFATEMQDPRYLCASFNSMDLVTQARKLPEAWEVMDKAGDDRSAIELNLLWSFLYDLQDEIKFGNPTQALHDLKAHGSKFLMPLLALMVELKSNEDAPDAYREIQRLAQ